MAYGLHYYSEFADDWEKQYRVEIHERDYSGDDLEVISGGNPFTIEMTEVDNIFTAIRPKKVSIEWTAEEDSIFEIEDLFITDDRKYILYFYEIDEDTEDLKILFSGYLVTVDCEEPFQSKPYHVQLSGMCSLTLLLDRYFSGYFNEFPFKISIKDIIGHCLIASGLELDFHVCVDLHEIQMSSGTNWLLEAEIDADGLRGKTCYEVLDGVLSSLNAYIVQDNNTWIIKGIPDTNSVNVKVKKYNHLGQFLGEEIINQSISIGTDEYDLTTPNLRPTANVIKKLADISSIIKTTISPGIASNRLQNGQFAFPILGGNMLGWDINLDNLRTAYNSQEPPGWQRAGNGTIDDPYRFEIRGVMSVKNDKPYKPADEIDHIDISDPIIIDAGLFDKGQKVKIIVGGAYRVRGVDGLYMELRLNDGDKDYTQWLDESGKWNAEKKLKNRHGIKVKTSVDNTENVTTPVNELPIHTFEVISEEITDYLKRDIDGLPHAIAKVYFRIFPGAFYSKKGEAANSAIDVSPLLVLEDFYISITTESLYEGDHTYVVDSDLPIRNANEVNYTSIIADKINITTPEQVRLVNRVMTGYMTLANNGALTYGWKRYREGVPYPSFDNWIPLQFKISKERIRQLCGKRTILQGTFLGYNAASSSSVFSQYDGETTPEIFYAITGWKWNVLDREYELTLNELSFETLTVDQEFVELEKSGGGNRGNRLYGNNSGGSSSGNGSSSPDIPDPINLDPIDPLYFVVGSTTTQSFDIGELVISGQLPIELTALIAYRPSWMLAPYEDRGVDGDLLTFTVTGTPTETGHEQILIELTDINFQKALVVVPIIMQPKTTNVNQVLDGTTLDILGVVPGFFPLPDLFNFRSKIVGTHDKIEITVIGGGTDGGSFNETTTREVTLTDAANYLLFDTIDGVAVESGVYNYEVVTYRGSLETSREEGSFTLYDEEYLAKYSAEFIDSASSEILGVINIDGNSSFTQIEGWDVKSIIDDLNHDKIHFTLKKDGVEVYNNEYIVTDTLTGEYNLFDSIQTTYGSGDYELLVDISLDSAAVYQRLVTFSIGKEDLKPQAGLELIEFTPNTTNYTVTQELPLFNGQYDLPDNWGIKIPMPSIDYDYVEWSLFDSTNGSLANINIESYTNYPQYREYTSDIDKENILIFGLKNSLDIGDIHRAPSSFRLVATFRIGGATGDITGIRQSDFSFRVPLGPGDYAGTRFLNIDGSTGVFTIVDENMPKQDRKYLIPEIGTIWSVSVREFDGEIFDKVVVKLSKKLSGFYEVLHFVGEIDSVLVYTSATDVNELPADNLAYVIGFLRPDGFRYLFDTSNNDVLIDGLGDYKVTFDFYLDDVLLGSKVTEFSLIDDTITDIPIKDCCGGDGGDLPIYPVEGIWGGDNKLLQVTLTENGTISAIEELNLDGVTITDDVWEFTYPPKSATAASVNDELVNYGQLIEAVAAGSADKEPVKTVATSNITLSGNQTINGYSTVTGDRVLVANQTDPKENGSYVAVAGAWNRSTDADTGIELIGATYLVTDGDATIIGTKWKVVNTPPIVLGTDNINIVKIQGAETDPTVGAWIKAITSDQITNWDTAYSIANNFNSLFDTRLSTKSTTSLSEGVNLYFTEARVRATPLSGLSIANSTISASDNVITAFGKLQGQITGVDTRWISGRVGVSSLNTTLNGGIKIYSDVTSSTGKPTGYGTILTFAGDTNTGNGGWVNQILASTDADLWFRQSISDPNIWSTTYKLWTTKHFTDTNIINWNTAYSWGDHALAGYILASNFNTIFDGRLATKTTNNLTEGTTNLYFSEARVRATLLTGLSVTTGLITATDSVLSAFGKLQGQISASGSVSGTVNYIAKFTSSNVLGNSLWFDNGTRTGYGTASPSSRLHISGSGSGSGMNSSISLTNTDSSNNWSFIAGGSSTTIPNNSLAIGDNTNYRVIISNNGNVGIGTSSSAAIDRLEVSGGNIRVGGRVIITQVGGVSPFVIVSTTWNQNLNSDLLDDQHGTYYLDSTNFTGTRATNWDSVYAASGNYLSGSGTSGYISKYTAAKTLAISGLFDTGSRLGYGTTSPASKLHISGSGSDLGFTLTNTASSNSWAFYAGSATTTIPNNSFSFGDNTNYRLLITDNGNVGIGTGATGAIDRLEVSGGNIRVNGRLIVTQSIGISPFSIISTTLNTNLNADLLDNQHGSYYLDSTNLLGTRSANWDVAYNWGNHASFGYLTSINSGNVTGALGYTPMRDDRQITINGNTQNLRDNPSYTVVTGSGSINTFPIWTGSNSLGNSLMSWTGSEIYANASLGVQGDSAFRSDLHVHQNLRIGKSGYHGTLIIHDLASAAIDSSAAFEIRSTTKGFLLPRMTYAQRNAISSPAVGLQIYQIDVSGASPVGVKTHYGSGVWVKNTISFD